LKVNIFFRADANANIGLGHITRCLAMADMLKQKFNCFFCIRETEASIFQLIERKKYKFHIFSNQNTYLEEATNFVELVGEKDIIVLDGYEFTGLYQKIIKERNRRLVSIVDVSNDLFLSDVIINHSIGANVMQYQTANYTKKYLGLRYALLRQEFIKSLPKKCSNNSEAFLLICFGGADIHNLTKKIAQLLVDNIDGKMNIIIGRAYSHKIDLESWAEEFRHKVNIFYDVSENEIIEIMKNSEVAVLSASSIAIEYLSVINGKLFIIQTADNQSNFYENAIAKRLAFPFEQFVEKNSLEWNYSLQNEMFDGNQAVRIIGIFENLCYEYNY
jgi:UDP-2,4-diacetamido-2,4,6-trideoxy-beta-L-altropyranose hydrolase